jgi:PRTRC genetic system protein A
MRSNLATYRFEESKEKETYVMSMNINQQTSIFDLLPENERKDLVPPVVEEKKSAKKSAARAKATVKPTEEPEPDVYDIDRVVYYAGHRLEVPSRTMKLEEVRAWLEETFPELTKERTEMVYDKNTGHIVPVLKGHKKGAAEITVYTEPPTPPVPPVYHLLDREGRVYEVRQTQTGVFTVPLRGQVGLRAQFQLFVPKIPVWCLREIVGHFQAEPDIEHLAYVVYDVDVNDFEVVWPEQQASDVTVEGTGFMETEQRFVVAHIHSHGRLPAFWSSTDDADEVRTGLYGVVGRVDWERPQLAFRYSCGGKFVKVAPSTVFEGHVESVVMSI